ncbi:MAG: hypothetical protein II332_06525 [Kiritimatiellae bacterium]|jgi:hypothetical protein|nr:hypothetical protein [Kiritimatiellia bacterium]
MTKKTISLLSLAISAIIIATGCEKSENSAIGWNSSSSSSSTSSSPSTTTPDSGSASASDQVPFSSLQWSYGGINGSGASHSGVNISGMSCSGPADASGNVAWKYDTDMSAWGCSYEELGGYFCFFIKEKDGVWRGGKLDWISSSRSSRNFHNINPNKYHGWTVSNSTSPTQVAMLILNKDCKRRSNVITTTWAF